MASPPNISVTNKPNANMESNVNRRLGPFPINAVPKPVPASQLVAPNESVQVSDHLRPNINPRALRPLAYVPGEDMKRRGYFPSSTSTLAFPTSYFPGPPGIPRYANNARSLNSIVIMNSRLPFPESQNPVLSGISFNDTICLGLPPKVTWDELNESPTNNADVMYLLKYTRELNQELKKKRRSRSTMQGKAKRTSKSSTSRSVERPGNSTMTVTNSSKVTNSSNSKTKTEQSQSKIAVVSGQSKIENPTAAKVSEQNASAVEKLKPSAMVVDSAEHDVPGIRNSDVSTSERRKISVTDLLKMKDNAPVDPKIIESIKQWKCFQYSGPRKNALALSAPELAKFETICKLAESTEKFFVNRGLESNSSVCSPAVNFHKDDDKLKHLMAGSWLDSDDDADANSKEILENLEGLIKNLRTNEEIPFEFGSPEKLEQVLGELTIRKKKKRRKRKSQGAVEKTDEIVSSKPNEVSDSVMSSVEKIDNVSTQASTEQESCNSVTKNKNKKKPWKKISNTVEESGCMKSPLTTDTENFPFDEYYDEVTIEKGLLDGTMVKEILRINSKNTKESYVYSQADSKDIFIDGVKDRNRGLEGDEVVVELYPEDKWKWFPDDTVQKCGKVVAITRKFHPRTAVGYLKIVYGKSQGIIIWPRDNRLPRIRVSEKSCPPKFRVDHKRYENTLFLAKITSWEAVKSAEGVVLEMLGDETALDVQSKCILQENNLDVAPFEEVDEYLPTTSYTIPVDEISKRLDLRSRCIFTIDPPSARDLDDALSCCILPSGHVEVGIHIADVTHYMLPDTRLDANAREKATSVYLTERVFHMLPMRLCELCSLTPNEDKLTFSVFATLDENADVVEHRFAKSVMRSCAQLTYAHAQEVIDKQNECVDEQSFPAVSNGFTVKDCADAIWRLHTLAAKMRKRRFAEGALRIDQPKILFALDDTGLPISYSLYEGQECNWLVEEFMLLANTLTANQIHQVFPEIALLRFHAAPKEKSLIKVVEYLEKVGIHIDVSSAGAIYRSMIQYGGSDELGVARMAVIMNLLVKPMPRACYTCSNPNIDNCADMWHYALNTPFYTHFTSPIRRYADVVVHRLLAACLGFAGVPNYTPDDIEKIAAHCNCKKNAAKKASEMSTELYLRLYLERSGPVRARAVVIDVKERFFDVIDLSMRTMGRVYVDKIKYAETIEFECEDGMPSLIIKWKGDEVDRTLVQIFMIVDVELSYKNTNKYNNNSLTVTLLKSAS